MKQIVTVFCSILATLYLPAICLAQVNSGSNGSDGALDVVTDTVIDMVDHPDGIYNYTSVNIHAGRTVTFIPNAKNTPVVWLVQNNCTIDGAIRVVGQSANASLGGPGGWAGGNGGSNPSSGLGPGGGRPSTSAGLGGSAGGGSFGTQGNGNNPGLTYGNVFLLPLLGGSGGGASLNNAGGGGGGGSICIAASGNVELNGSISANGGDAGSWFDGGGGYYYGAGGSGGGIRIFSTQFKGTGSISAVGGNNGNVMAGGLGRVRIDTLQNTFGNLPAYASVGFQPVVVPVAGQGVQLTVASVGGISVTANPTGQLVTPDAIVPGQQANPIPIVVRCLNLPLNTAVTVTVKPANGASVSALGYNNAGTQASSTATISLNMPRGGGIIFATAGN